MPTKKTRASLHRKLDAFLDAQAKLETRGGYRETHALRAAARRARVDLILELQVAGLKVELPED